MISSACLKQAGLQPTFARMSILAVFSAMECGHLTAEEVQQQLVSDGVEISMATIYRALNQIEAAGILKRHKFNDGRVVFELNRKEHHDHVVCLQCGKWIEFKDKQIEERQKTVAAEMGFELQDHVLQLFANCVDPGCPSKKNLG